ncbi:MAG: hypothetical protein OQK82_07955 [Candidatus Pacearchaeota archaeon]|nr:hypothetical protein [Candidatus Pacearchaeota archaeon]
MTKNCNDDSCLYRKTCEKESFNKCYIEESDFYHPTNNTYIEMKIRHLVLDTHIKNESTTSQILKRCRLGSNSRGRRVEDLM